MMFSRRRFGGQSIPGLIIRKTGDEFLSTSSFSEIERTQAFTFFSRLKYSDLETRFLFSTTKRDIGGIAIWRGMWVFIRDNNNVVLQLINTRYSNHLHVEFLNTADVETLSVTYDGGSDANTVKCYVNGSEVVSKTIVENSLSATIVNGDGEALIGGSFNLSDRFNPSFIRSIRGVGAEFSFVDYEKNTSEIQNDHSNLSQSEGIGSYLMAVRTYYPENISVLDSTVTFNSVDSNSYVIAYNNYPVALSLGANFANINIPVIL